MPQPRTLGTVIPELAQFATSFRLTKETRTAAIEAIADTVTAAAAAPRFPFVKPIQQAYGVGLSSIWFTGQTASAMGAGFANALTSAAMDLDDGHRGSRGHPGAAVVPAVLAELDLLTSERRQVSDEAVLLAIAVGYEVSLRIASAKSFYARTGFWAGIAAAAAVASLRKLPAEKFAHAIAIAAETGPHMAKTTTPPAWPQPNGTDVKEGIPWGVVTGMAAVPMAKAGMKGPLDLVDHAPFFDADEILADRKLPMICDTYTKFHAACRHVHGPVEAFLELMQTHKIALQDILRIRVEAYSGALRIPNSPKPATLTDAQYSIPYCIGLVAEKGPCGLLPMTLEDIGRVSAEELAKRVSIEVCESFEQEFPTRTLCKVSVETKDATFDSPATEPSGEADARPDWSRRQEKLRYAASATLSSSAIEGLLEAIQELSSGKINPLRAQIFAHHEPPRAR
ncbi:2-methylcitrate dehydratase PrpD [Epibacterium ulvae]|uniref:2-methylcitrate dehydratase PrpD n=1 Tax=Epibacterium ulvae TaxID=1156985 RepID=A0A1G5RK66_9RHOB|nr:MmgE/PrpD family protein [Epibacterium ulvae]SCZ74200.1 2-methylcitrate dehydratase PrpD [Epibacterium ulvae]